MFGMKNLSVSLKLNLLLSAVLIVLLFVTVSLLVFNTRKLTEEIANEKINEEVTITQEHLSEIEKQLAVDVNFTASSIPFVQAVGRRSPDAITELITGANAALEMDDIDVYDGDGKHLAGLNSGEARTDDFVKTALSGKSASGVSIETLDNKSILTISAVAPVVSLRQTTVLGAVQMSRQIDDKFLRGLTFQREGVYLGIVYDNQIQARNAANQGADAKALYQDVTFDPELVKVAATGQAVIPSELAYTGAIPYKVAYIPLSRGDKTSPATLMVLVQLKEISTFQNNTLTNTIVVFVLLAVLAILIIFVALQAMAIRPLVTMKTAAEKLSAGDYSQRMPVTKQDEVGKLAQTFNEMGTAIQNREVSLQKAREQAERSDQVKSAFLASMSHELRTPLNAVINFTSFVVDGDTGPVNEQQSELLTEVISSAKHLLNLINDVLDMSKIEAGSLTLFIEDSVNLNTILNTVATTGRGLLKDKSVKLEVDIPESLSLMRADKQRILQILLNLISNACKFTKEGQITLRAVQQNNEVLISVADTGPGIAPEDQSLVFEAFKQTTTGLRQGGGTGLGMPIARSLAEAHQGRLWLESEYGKGTTFFVALPVKSDKLVLSLT